MINAPSPVIFGPWSSITVGVADLELAMNYWVDQFGFEIVRTQEAPDSGHARLWGIAPEDIIKQVLLRSPTLDHGNLHLVQFANAEKAVRDGAQSFDLAPKNLDIYVDNLPKKFEELKRLGFSFRAESYSEVTAEDGTRFREIHLDGHDSVNIVLLEILGEIKHGSENPSTGIGLAILTVPDIKLEREFFMTVLGLEHLSHNIFKGPEIEKMIGLPSGSSLDVSIVGNSNTHYGRIELVEYQGVKGKNLFPKAKPKATGILHINFTLSDTQNLSDHLRNHSTHFTEFQNISSFFGEGNVISFRTPAGLEIFVYQQS